MTFMCCCLNKVLLFTGEKEKHTEGCGFSVSPACEEPIWIVELKMNSLLPPGGSFSNCRLSTCGK